MDEDIRGPHPVQLRHVARGLGQHSRRIGRAPAGGPVRRASLAETRGVALVRFPNGEVHRAELHWYEAHGVGRRKMKVKRVLD